MYGLGHDTQPQGLGLGLELGLKGEGLGLKGQGLGLDSARVDLTTALNIYFTLLVIGKC